VTIDFEQANDLAGEPIKKSSWERGQLQAALHCSSPGLLPYGRGHTPRFSRDVAHDCCADLEERIADLEATTVRKGNSKIEMSIGGTVSHAALSWDDGQNTDSYIVGDFTLSPMKNESQAEPHLLGELRNHWRARQKNEFRGLLRSVTFW
jgi:hypothetical protein